MRLIHLDAHATTPVHPAVLEAMLRVYSEANANPASAHQEGRRARRFLEDAREKVATLLNAAPDEMVFTSGATESNNLAIFGLAGEAPGHILTSRIEHPCVVGPVEELARKGHDVDWITVNSRGAVETKSILDGLRPDTRLVAIMLANHETGVIQPVRHVAKRIGKAVSVHCDAAQAVGKIPVDFHDLAVSTLSFSAHKFGGPKGVGGLLIRRGVVLTHRTFGGHQQHGHRPGTEPVALAVGLAVALEEAEKDRETQRRRLDEDRRRFLDRLRQLAGPVIVNGPEPVDPDGLPSVLNLSFPGCRADLLLMKLDLAGVACSTGSACSSGSLTPSTVLRAMHISEEVLRSAIRFSFDRTLTTENFHEAAERIARCVREMRNSPGEDSPII